MIRGAIKTEKINDHWNHPDHDQISRWHVKEAWYFIDDSTEESRRKLLDATDDTVIFCDSVEELANHLRTRIPAPEGATRVLVTTTGKVRVAGVVPDKDWEATNVEGVYTTKYPVMETPDLNQAERLAKSGEKIIYPYSNDPELEKHTTAHGHDCDVIDGEYMYSTYTRGGINRENFQLTYSAQRAKDNKRRWQKEKDDASAKQIAADRRSRFIAVCNRMIEALKSTMPKKYEGIIGWSISSDASIYANYGEAYFITEAHNCSLDKLLDVTKSPIPFFDPKKAYRKQPAWANIIHELYIVTHAYRDAPARTRERTLRKWVEHEAKLLKVRTLSKAEREYAEKLPKPTIPVPEKEEPKK